MFPKFLIFAFFVLAVASAASLNKAKTRGSIGCGKYEKQIQANGGKQRCIPDADSCVDSIDFKSVACFVSPCTDFKEQCAKATECFEDPCDACKPIYYDSSFNKVC